MEPLLASLVISSVSCWMCERLLVGKRLKACRHPSAGGRGETWLCGCHVSWPRGHSRSCNFLTLLEILGHARQRHIVPARAADHADAA
eukprot:363662-Chlamydomonas_euryale.AAC.22